MPIFFDCPLMVKDILSFTNNYKKVEVKKVLTNLKHNNNIIVKDGHIILKKYNFKNILKTRQKNFQL